MVQRRSRYLADYESMTKSEAMEIRPSAFPVAPQNHVIREPPPEFPAALVAVIIIILMALALNG